MYTTINDRKWCVKRTPSIFISRKGKEDVTVSVAGYWGGQHADGKKYRTCRRLAAESGEILSDYERIPADFSEDWLRQAGYIDTKISDVVLTPDIPRLYSSITQPKQECNMVAVIEQFQKIVNTVRIGGEDESDAKCRRVADAAVETGKMMRGDFDVYVYETVGDAASDRKRDFPLDHFVGTV